jgi:G3E family GTPase
VRSADLLVLNKVDLVPAEQLRAVEERLRAIEPEAPLVRCVRGGVDTALFFPPEAPGGEGRGEPPAAPPHHHERFATSVLSVEPEVAPARLEALLRDPALLRAKGFVRTSEGVRLVQLVGRRLEWEEVEEPPESALVGRVVLIRRQD